MFRIMKYREEESCLHTLSLRIHLRESSKPSVFLSRVDGIKANRHRCQDFCVRVCWWSGNVGNSGISDFLIWITREGSEKSRDHGFSCSSPGIKRFLS